MLWKESLKRPSKCFFLHSAGFFAFIGLYLAFTFPLILVFNSYYFGGTKGDPAVYLWLLETNAKSVLSVPSVGFNIGLFYPYGQALAYTDNFLLPSLIAKPLFALHLSSAGILNFLVLLACGLNGYFTYCLARFCRLPRLPSVFAGTAFMLFPFLQNHMMHPQLQFAFFLPATMLAALKFLYTRKPWHASLIGLSVFAAFFVSVYYCFFAILLTAFTCFSYFLSRRSTLMRKDLLTLFLANVPWIACLYLATLPYQDVQRAFGRRSLAEVAFYRATPASFVSAPESNLLYGRWSSSLSHFEARLYPGLAVLFFALMALGQLLRRTKNRVDYCDSQKTELSTKGGVATVAFVGALFFLLSLGPVDYLGGAFSPFSLLYRYFPGFGAMRACARFGVVTVLCLTILAARGLSDSLSWLTSHAGKAWGLALCCVVVLLSAFELRCAPAAEKDETPLPAISQALAERSGAEAVLVLPLAFLPEDPLPFASLQTEYMRLVQPSGRPLMNGLSGLIPPYYRELHKELTGFPDKHSLALLGSVVGLRYIIYCSPHHPSFSAEAFSAQVREVSDQLSILSTDKNGNYLLDFHPQIRAEDALLLFPPQTGKAREVEFYLRYLPGATGLRGESESGQDRLILEVFSASRQKASRELLDSFSIARSVAPKPYAFILPPSPQGVKPIIVKFKVLGLAPEESFILENVRIR